MQIFSITENLEISKNAPPRIAGKIKSDTYIEIGTELPRFSRFSLAVRSLHEVMHAI